MWREYESQWPQSELIELLQDKSAGIGDIVTIIADLLHCESAFDLKMLLDKVEKREPRLITFEFLANCIVK